MAHGQRVKNPSAPNATRIKGYSIESNVRHPKILVGTHYGSRNMQGACIFSQDWWQVLGPNNGSNEPKSYMALDRDGPHGRLE